MLPKSVVIHRDSGGRFFQMLVVGATGYTGHNIVNGLLDSGNFRVAALVHPAAVSKPAVKSLRGAGVDIRVGDISGSVEALKGTLAGVDVLISAIVGVGIIQQKDIFYAAKGVGVKRVVPCHFATPGRKGVRALHDEKLEIRDFIERLGVPHTKVSAEFKAVLHQVHGTGTNRTLLTDSRHVGIYVARIVADPRTLNRAVIVWEDEVTELEVHQLAERASGEAEAFRAQRVHVSGEDILKFAADARASVARGESTFAALALVAMNEYMYTTHILNENSLQNAKRLGYLDARELYPDIPTYSLEEFAKEFYTLEEPGEPYFRSS